MAPTQEEASPSLLTFSCGGLKECEPIDCLQHRGADFADVGEEPPARIDPVFAPSFQLDTSGSTSGPKPWVDGVGMRLEPVPAIPAVPAAAPNDGGDAAAAAADPTEGAVHAALRLHHKRLLTLEKELSVLRKAPKHARPTLPPSPPPTVSEGGRRAGSSKEKVLIITPVLSEVTSPQDDAAGTRQHPAEQLSSPSRHSRSKEGMLTVDTQSPLIETDVSAASTARQRGNSKSIGDAAALQVDEQTPILVPIANEEDGTMFDQDYLKVIYNKPTRKARKRGALIGGGILGLLSMPFGPLGMALGGFIGAGIGGAIGSFQDYRTQREKLQESERQKRRLRSLVRWAHDRFYKEEDKIELIERVTLTFKPVADIAEGSKTAQETLRFLEKWISQPAVCRHLFVYMDTLLQKWQQLNRVDFLRSMRVFDTLVTMYRFSRRKLNDAEAQFKSQMEQLLQHSSVQLVMAHARAYPTDGETAVMECMVYTDAILAVSRSKPEGAGLGVTALLQQAMGRGDDASSSYKPTPDPSSAGDEEVPVLDDHSDFSETNPLELQLDLSEDDLVEHQLGRPSSPNSESHGDLPVGAIRSLDTLPDLDTKIIKPAVPKRPFFKGWGDFMDFDLDIKRKMPITDGEFLLLLEKETEGCTGWDLCVERKEVKVVKILVGPLVTLRAWATVSGVDMHVVFYMFTCMEERLKWDKIFGIFEMIEQDTGAGSIIFSLLKPGYGVTPREFLQFRRVTIEPDGSILIIMRGAEHASKPGDKSYIRAESLISGYCLRSVVENGENKLSIFILACQDIKGLVPKWIINSIAPRAPPQWVNDLHAAASAYMKANPDYKEKMEEYMRPFYKYSLPPLETLLQAQGGSPRVSKVGAEKKEEVP